MRDVARLPFRRKLTFLLFQHLPLGRYLLSILHEGIVRLTLSVFVKPSDYPPNPPQGCLSLSSPSFLSAPSSRMPPSKSPPPPSSTPAESGVVRVYLEDHSFLTPLGLGRCYKSIGISTHTTGRELFERIRWKMLKSVLDSADRKKVGEIFENCWLFGWDDGEEWAISETECIWRFEQNECGTQRRMVFRRVKRERKIFGTLLFKES